MVTVSLTEATPPVCMFCRGKEEPPVTGRTRLMKAYSTYLKSLQSNVIPSVCFFLGDEDFLKDEAEKVLFDRVTEANKDRTDRIVFHGSANDADSVVETCSSSSLFGGYRFVVLSEFESWSTAEQKSFLSWLNESSVAPGTVLVVKSSLRKLPVTVANSSTHVFWKFYESQLIKWAASRLKDGGLKVDNDTVRHMVELYSGEDIKTLRLLAAEIDKLILYLGKDGVVDKKVVSRVCSAPPQSEFYRFLNALFQRKHRHSARYARELFSDTPSAVTGYMSVLASSFATMVQLKALSFACPDLWKDLVEQAKRRQARFLKKEDRNIIDKAVTSIKNQMIETAGEHLGAAMKKTTAFSLCRKILDVEGFSVEELISALELSTSAEQALKSGKGDPLVELDILISRICVGGLL